MGIIDAVLFRWEMVVSLLPEQRQRAVLANELDPEFVGLAVSGSSVHQLRGDKLAFTSFVWMSAAKRPKKQAANPSPAAVAEEELGVGTMGARKFQEWWFAPVVELLKVVSEATCVEQVYEHLSKAEYRMSPYYSEADRLKDCETLSNYLGLKVQHVMDGASCHKLTDPNYVPLYGPKGLYGPQPGSDPTDSRCGWQMKARLEWLDTGDEDWMINLRSESLFDLRARVEQNSTRVKFSVKSMALSAGQDLYFTPPFVGKLLNPVELFWSDRKRVYKRTPASERKGDSRCVELMLRILKEPRDMSVYMHKPGMHAHAILLACRDFENKMFRRTPNANDQPVLIPELFQALRRYGREVQMGEDADWIAHGEVPNDGSVSWDGVVLRADDIVSAPVLDTFLSTESLNLAQQRREHLVRVRMTWADALRSRQEVERRDAELKAKEAAERAEREAMVEQRIQREKVQREA